MISTFQRNRHFRKVSVNKTFTHVQDQKKAMSPRDIPLTFRPSVKSLGKNENLFFNNPEIVAHLKEPTNEVATKY